MLTLQFKLLLGFINTFIIVFCDFVFYFPWLHWMFSLTAFFFWTWCFVPQHNTVLIQYNAVSVPNGTTLNGLVKTLEMAIKSYKTPTTTSKQTTALVFPIRTPPPPWPHKEAKCCVQQLEPCVLLVPHRLSSREPLQTDSMGSRGGGAWTLKGTGKGAICWDKWVSSGASGHTQL